MALEYSIVYNKLSALLDEKSSTFVGFGSSNIDVANKWGDAIDVYAGAVSPTSTTRAAAKSNFITAMQAMDAVSMNGIAVFKAAFATYAAELALGFTAAGFTGTPPAIPILIESLFSLGMGGADGSTIASAWASLIDAWFRTGIVTNISSGATSNWQ